MSGDADEVLAHVSPRVARVDMTRYRALLHCVKALRSLSDGFECDCGNCADCEAVAALREYDATRVQPILADGTTPKGPNAAAAQPARPSPLPVPAKAGSGAAEGAAVAWAWQGQMRTILVRVAKGFEGTELALERAGELLDEAYQRGLQVGRAAGVEECVRALEAKR